MRKHEKLAERIFSSKLKDLSDQLMSLQQEKKLLQDENVRLSREMAASRGAAKHSFLFVDQRHVIRDPIYGIVPLSQEAFETLDLPQMQRLKHIRQNGLLFHVYPGAVHTRFEHSVGVYHLARQALAHFICLDGVELDETLARAFLAAALLHDIGHFPFSHALEEIRVAEQRVFDHVVRATYMLENDSELRGAITRIWGSNIIDYVIAILDGARNIQLPSWMQRLIASSVDLDKMDYLKRDSYHIGVPYGHIETQRLIAALRTANQGFTVEEKDIGNVEQLILAKFLMYRNVYWHHTVRIVTAMFRRAIWDFLEDLGLLDEGGLVNSDRLRQLASCTEEMLYPTMCEIARDKRIPDSTRELFERLENRRLHKRAHVFYCTEEPGKTLEGIYRNASARKRKEEELAARFANEARNVGIPPVLIDVCEPESLVPDVQVHFPDPPPGQEPVLAWDHRRYISVFDRAELDTMHNSIRKVRYFYAPDPEFENLKDAIRENVEHL